MKVGDTVRVVDCEQEFVVTALVDHNVVIARPEHRSDVAKWTSVPAAAIIHKDSGKFGSPWRRHALSSEAFAEFLIERRGPLSQAQMASRIGCSVGTLIAMEKGRAIPTLPNIYYLSSEFGVSVSELVGMFEVKV